MKNCADVSVVDFSRSVSGDRNRADLKLIILEWTTSLDTSSSTLFVCRPGTGDCIQRDLSPTSGYTGISARRRYANFFYLQSLPTRSLSTLVG